MHERALHAIVLILPWLRALALCAMLSLCGATLGAEAEEPVSLQGRIALLWADAKGALEQHNDRAAHEALLALREGMRKWGIDSFEEYSLALVRAGDSRFQQGDREGAQMLCRHALELSPRSPAVLLQGFDLAVRSGIRQPGEMFGQLLTATYQSLKGLLSLAVFLIYPLLWALTVGYLVFFFLYFVQRTDQIVDSLQRVAPGHGSLVAGGLFVLAVLAPTLGGPLLCLTAWTTLFLLARPDRRWLGIGAGTLVVIWGAFIPFRENGARWLAEPGVAAVLQVLSRQADVKLIAPETLAALEDLSIGREPDQIIIYTRAELLRRAGSFAEAEAILTQLERAQGKEGWIVANKGLLALLSSDAPRAARFFEEAEKLGLREAAFLYNYSALKVQLLDTAGGRALFERAQKENPKLVRELTEREAAGGESGENALLSILPPTRYLLNSIFIRTRDSAESTARTAELSSALLPGGSPPLIALLGFVVFGIGLLGGQRARSILPAPSGSSKIGVLATLVRLLPGGSWILADRLARAVAILAVSAFLLMPIVGLPPEMEVVRASCKVVLPVYSAGVGVVLFFVLYLGFRIREEGV